MKMDTTLSRGTDATELWTSFDFAMIWFVNLTISDADRLTRTLEPARSTRFPEVVSVNELIS